MIEANLSGVEEAHGDLTVRQGSDADGKHPGAGVLGGAVRRVLPDAVRPGSRAHHRGASTRRCRGRRLRRRAEPRGGARGRFSADGRGDLWWANDSALWLQIDAGVSNLPLKPTKAGNAPMLGSAILAPLGAGCYPDIPAAAGRMVEVTRVVEPDAARHEAYRRAYEAYKDLYPALEDLLHRRAASFQGPQA